MRNDAENARKVETCAGADVETREMREVGDCCLNYLL